MDRMRSRTDTWSSTCTIWRPYEWLISHDAGWYRPGEPDGRLFRTFDTLFAKFLPALRGAGFNDAEVYQLTGENPHRAFTVGVRAK